MSQDLQFKFFPACSLCVCLLLHDCFMCLRFFDIICGRPSNVRGQEFWSSGTASERPFVCSGVSQQLAGELQTAPLDLLYMGRAVGWFEAHGA